MKYKILVSLSFSLILAACGGDSNTGTGSVNPAANPGSVSGTGTTTGGGGGGQTPGTVIVPGTSGGGGAGSTSITVTLSTEEATFFTLINQLRQSKGVAPLQLSPILQKTAASHSAYMDAGDSLDHSEPAPNTNSWDRIANAGGNFNTSGENIACGNESGEGTYQQWVNSPGHYANMIDSGYQYIGIARAGTPASEANHGCPYYWTTDFAGN